MPLWVQYLNSAIGLLGFIFTLTTLKTTYSVRKHLLTQQEIAEFKANFENISGQIAGFQNLIRNNISRDKSVLNEIDYFLEDIESKYTFFSIKTKFLIKSISKLVKTSKEEYDDWDDIVKKLIRLNNSLKKEKL